MLAGNKKQPQGRLLAKSLAIGIALGGGGGAAAPFLHHPVGGIGGFVKGFAVHVADF